VTYRYRLSRTGVSYLGQGRVLCINDDPTDLNHLGAILGDIYSVLIAGGSNVNDAVLVKLTLALALVRGGARLRGRGRVGVRLVLGRSSHCWLFLSFAAIVQTISYVREVVMLQLMLLPDLTSPTPYAKSCHCKEYRVQGSREREGGRSKLGSKLVSTMFTAGEGAGRGSCHADATLAADSGSGEQTRRSRGRQAARRRRRR
jgi:hypothetical protein